jgi:N-acetylmuramoyl-L-alanine amidase
MSEYHVVSQGEHLFGIAVQYGFTSYTPIWEHANNSELKNKRKNPNVLFPGDRLFIPDRKTGEYSRNTDKRHSFRLKQPPLKLRLVLQDQYEKPIDSASCILVVEGESHRLTTDSEGKLELVIPPTARSAYLVVQDADETPHDGVTVSIKVGDLDPVEEISGQQGRLRNLGYFWAEVDGNSSPDFLSAVEEFQCDHSLTVDGICGPQTQAKLKDEHGC